MARRSTRSELKLEPRRPAARPERVVATPGGVDVDVGVGEPTAREN
jgi:hypothetical protein